ncbi:hypothetical protein LSAT2_029477 [Lamellibrachia satsuma]|nr:hypothetical protein LSAT2_029477 [Lamellibrachia satsuma]
MARTKSRLSCVLLAFLLLTFMQQENSVDGLNQIPLSMWKAMENMRSSEDFIKNMIAPKQVEPEGGRIRPGGGRVRPSSTEDRLFTEQGALDPNGVEIIADKMAEPARCVPSVKAVPIPRDDKVDSIFFPTCVNVQRCGGCCGSEMLSCLPTQTKMVTYHVLNATYPYPGAPQFKYNGLASFRLEKHTACECRCTVQSHHCHPTKHTYLADSCRCQCKNTRGSTQCPLRKKWDERRCSCICEKQYSCYDNEYFDQHSCSCQRRGRMRSPSTRSRNPCAGIICEPTKEPIITGNSCACKVDPCEQQTCRVQFEPVRVGSKCECRYAQSAGGDIRPGFIDAFGFGSRRAEDADGTFVVEGGINLDNLGGGDDFSLPEEEPTTTTARPASRPGRRRRPSRGHSALPGSMIPTA